MWKDLSNIFFEILHSRFQHSPRNSYTGIITIYQRRNKMASYPIWNKVTACIYKGQKSYGVKQTGDVSVYVGSSAKNSHHFLNHSTTMRERTNGDREFRFYVDGVLIKRVLLPKGGVDLVKLKNVPNDLQTGKILYRDDIHLIDDPEA